MNQISLTEKAHSLVSEILNPGDVAIDATAGNGHDTVFLSNIVGKTGQVFAFDIQQSAIDETKKRLLPNGLNSVRLVNKCHGTMQSVLAELNIKQVKAIMFNLGYLPGSDKVIRSEKQTTEMALDCSINLLAAGGVLTIIAYPGHEGGKQETEYIDKWIKTLALEEFQYEIFNSFQASDSTPVLFVIYRIDK